jgi:hypothetical protein
MNEQIRTLALQAGMNKMNQRSDGFFVVDEKVFEKFAKLIVKECSAFVYNYPEKYMTRNQTSEICFGMEKEFGVE